MSFLGDAPRRVVAVGTPGPRGLPGPTGPRREPVVALVGDGLALAFTITHNLGSRRVIVQVFETGGTFQQVYPTIELPTLDTARVVFSTPPALNAYEVVVG